MAINHCGRCTANSTLLLALSIIFLGGCSGGISGTGDGGPIIVVTNAENLDSSLTIMPIDGAPDGTADGTADGATDGTTDGTADGTSDGTTGSGMDTVNTESAQLPQVYFEFPATLAGEPVATNSTLSVYQPLRAQFNVVNQRLLDTQVWIDLVATQLTVAEGPCGTNIDCIAEQLDTAYLYTSDIMMRDLDRRVASLDPQLSTAERSARTSEIRNRLITNLDSTIELAVDNYQPNQQIRITSGGAILDLTWRPGSDTSAMRYTDNNITLHAMHYANNSRFTFRLYSRTEALLLTAAFEPVSDGLLYEADLHQADQSSENYVRGFSDQLSGTLLARHPADDTDTPLIRERYLSGGELLSLQLCERCETTPDWQEQLQNPGDSDQLYALFESRFGQFEQTIADDLTISNLDESVDEWLVTNSTSSTLPNGNEACSGQRVGPNLRNICWTINIDPNQAQVFQEQLQPNGELNYQLLE